MRTNITMAVLLLLLLTATTTFAQNMYGSNPADPDLLEAGFSNPALNAGLKDRLVLALTSHHVGVSGGFFGVKSGIISYHLPWVVRGAAAGVQFLDAGLYSQSTVRVSYGRFVVSSLALGANLDVFNRSFDRSQFVGWQDSPFDPVFKDGTSKSGLSAGIGATLRVSRTVTLGAALEHLNRPDLAMGPDPFKQPLLFSLGLKVYGQQINGTSTLNPLRVDGYSGSALTDAADRVPGSAQAGVEIPFSRASIRGFLDASLAQLEAEAPLYGSLYFNYRYSYPLTTLSVASGGTHRFGFLVDLDRMPVRSPYPALPLLPRVESELTPQSTAPRGFMFVYASTDTMSRMRLDVKRTVEEGIRAHDLGLLFPEDLGDIKSALHPTPLTELDLLDARDPTLKLEGLYSTGYRGALEGVGLLMTDSTKPPEAQVLTFPGAERRANALLNLMTGDRVAVKSKVPLFSADRDSLRFGQVESMIRVGEEVQDLLYPATAVFHFESVFVNYRGGGWRFEIRNQDEETVRTFQGQGGLPDSLVWDWKRDNADVIAPGTYTYLFRALDNRGRQCFSQRGLIKVTYEHRTLAVDVTRTPRVGEIEADRYLFIVGPHGAGGLNSPPDSAPK